MLLVSLLSYVDRNSLAILAPAILHETHLSGEQYGAIIACFSWAHMLGNPLWGHLPDRMGVHRGMTVAVGIRTVFEQKFTALLQVSYPPTVDKRPIGSHHAYALIGAVGARELVCARFFGAAYRILNEGL